MFLITANQHSKFPDSKYYWTGNMSLGDYPPRWSWRAEMAVWFSTEDIANQWKDKLNREGILSNDGEPVTLYVSELK